MSLIKTFDLKWNMSFLVIVAITLEFSSNCCPTTWMKSYLPLWRHLEDFAVIHSLTSTSLTQDQKSFWLIRFDSFFRNRQTGQNKLFFKVNWLFWKKILVCCLTIEKFSTSLSNIHLTCETCPYRSMSLTVNFYIAVPKTADFSNFTHIRSAAITELMSPSEVGKAKKRTQCNRRLFARWDIYSKINRWFRKKTQTQ